MNFAFVIVPIEIDFDILAVVFISRDVVMFFRVSMRWLASLQEVYLRPKSLMTRLN